MSDEVTMCTATTKTGTPCKNRAVAGMIFCRIHAKVTESAPDEPSAEANEPTPEQRHQFEATIAEINRLAKRLQEMVPGYVPPAFSPTELARLLKENMERFTPEMRLDILRDLQAGLSGPTAKDLLDLDTWKGLWYLLNYSAESQSRTLFMEMRQVVSSLPGMNLLASLPGASTVSEVMNMLEGSSPRDFMDVDTWKGIWYIVNYSMKYEMDEMRKRIMGETDEEDEEE
jgi:hypothetical protein